MGVTRKIIINTCIELMGEPLNHLGYSLRDQPPVMGEEFWFEKPGKTELDKDRVIEFQPSGFSSEDLFELAINFMKGNLIKGIDDRSDPRKVLIWNKLDYVVRLAPRIWDASSSLPDYWWHINTHDKLIIACQDILDKLLSWGIPFLEDDNKTINGW